MTRYEKGLSRGVFFPRGSPAEPWLGLVSITTSEDSSDVISRYIDGRQGESGQRLGYFSGTIEAYTYPKSFDSGIPSRRAKNFGLSFRTQTDDSYKLHLVYNVTASPTKATRQFEKIENFSWDFSAKPAIISPGVFSAHLVVDASVAYPEALSELEDLLYGTATADARLPSPGEVLDIFERHSILKVTDNGDGTFAVDGPDSAITMLDSTTFQITWPSAVYIDAVTYTISSL